MINNESKANMYNTIPHHEFNEHFDSDLMNSINVKMDNARDKMSAILQSLNQLLLIIYP